MTKPDWRIDAVFAAAFVCTGLAASGRTTDSLAYGVLIGLFIQLIGSVFLLSYYFPDRSHLLRWAMSCCLYTSIPVRGPRMALVWGGFAIVVGALAMAQALLTGTR